MSSDNPSLRERKKLATRDRLLEAAQELFVEVGYDATTMDDIADRAEVSRATVFNYFPRKDALFPPWIERRRAVVAELLAREEGQSVDTITRLEHAFATLCELLEADSRVSRAVTGAWVRAGGPLMPGTWDTADLLAETIAVGQERGDVRGDIDAGAAGRALLDVYSGALIRWSAEHDAAPPSMKQALAPALDIVLDGLRTRA